MAIVNEGQDAAGGRGTSYDVDVGDVIYGELSSGDDIDWYEVRLEEGETYVFQGYGRGGAVDGLSDPTLALYDSNGNRVAFNDDVGGDNTFSQISYTANRDGTFYVAIDGYSSSDDGEYGIQIATDVFTPEQAGIQLSDFGWGIPTRVAFEPGSDGVITVDLTGLTADGKQLARWALDAWEDLIDVDFREVSGSADIAFDDNEEGAFAGPRANQVTGEIISSTVNIGTGWLNDYGTTIGSYSFLTYIHEVGHALGLGHAGEYNGTADYPNDVTFLNDSHQLTVMSYFEVRNNTFINATDALPITLMIADIEAAKNLYGDATAYSGNTTWGAGSNVGGYLGEIFSTVFDGASRDRDLWGGQNFMFTINDTGGRDTLALQTVNFDQRIDMRPGAISDLNGRIGNMILSLDTVIEEIKTGDGDDTITGNGANNRIVAGGGNDVVNGGGGTDTAVINARSSSLDIGVSGGVVTITSSQGRDTYRSIERFELIDGTFTLAELLGGGGGTTGATPGNDTLIGTEGNDRIEALAGDDIVEGLGGNDELLGQAGNDTIRGGAGNDQIAASDGNDQVYGGSGRDNIGGGYGNDRIFGESGNDTIGAGPGNDYVDAGSGNDLASGGAGNDKVLGRDGNDTLAGSFGNDEIEGGNGRDNIGGGSGVDIIRAGSGDDSVGAGQDNDIVFGGTGNDFLGGGDGRDTLFGGDGNDRINGGNGNDVLVGGGGADDFVFVPTRGEFDRIKDFEVGIDDIQIGRYSGGFNDLNITDVTVGGVDGAAVDVNGHRIFLEDVVASDLTANDFIL